MNTFREVTTRSNVDDFLNSITKKTLLIGSPTSMKNLKFENRNIEVIKTNIISKSKEMLDEFCDKNRSKYIQIIGLGGGTPIDIAKYISYKINCKFIVIPSMFSSNTYSTNKVALTENKKKKTFDAKLADEIILDKDLIKKAPKQNLYGFADIFSIYTALKDWEIANKEINEKIDNEVFIKSKNLLISAINFVKNHSLKEINDSIDTLYDIIGESGDITNKFGTGRPESGSEHIFARALEDMIEVPHGISVSIGILIMSILQDNYSDEIFYCIKKLNVLEDANKYGINMNLVKNVLNSIKKRPDRYCIIDTLDYNSKKLKLMNEMEDENVIFKILEKRT